MKYIQFCDINNTQYTIALDHLVGTKAARPYTSNEDEIYYVILRDLPPIHVTSWVYNQIHVKLYETNKQSTIYANG